MADFIDMKYTSKSQFELNMEELNMIPIGWANSLIPELEKELRAVLGKYLNDWIVVQAKEKYGQLRIYWTWNDRNYTNKEIKELDKICKKLNKIIDKYEQISLETCVKCGEESTTFSKIWTLPFCDDCEEE